CGARENDAGRAFLRYLHHAQRKIDRAPIGIERHLLHRPAMVRAHDLGVYLLAPFDVLRARTAGRSERETREQYVFPIRGVPLRRPSPRRIRCGDHDSKPLRKMLSLWSSVKVAVTVQSAVIASVV